MSLTSNAASWIWWISYQTIWSPGLLRDSELVSYAWKDQLPNTVFPLFWSLATIMSEQFGGWWILFTFLNNHCSEYNTILISVITEVETWSLWIDDDRKYENLVLEYIPTNLGWLLLFVSLFIDLFSWTVEALNYEG